MARVAKKKKKDVVVPRKSAASKLAEEKHIGVETTVWANIPPEKFEYTLYWTLRHYAYFYDVKDAFKWASGWVKQNRTKDEYRLFRASPERFFSQTVGGLCRCIENGATFDKRKMDLINNEIDLAIDRGRRAEEEKAKEPKVNIVKKSPADIVKERTSDFIAEIEEVLDMFDTKVYVDWENYSVYNELQKIDAPYNIAKGVADYYTPLVDELKELIEKKTPDLVEAYGRLSVKKRKQYLKIIEMIVADAELYMTSKKTVRKSRKKKVASSGQQVAKLKFLKESKEYKMVSVDPVSIVGATEVYLFNTKYRRVQYLVTNSKQGFQVKGTTIQNVDLEQSYQKTIRKPEEFLSDFLKAPKVKSRKVLNELSTKPAETNGRVSDQTIIAKVY